MPILGIVENMSHFVAARTAASARASSARAAASGMADEYGAPLLAQLPLEPETREGGDEGMPIVVRQPDSAQALAFRDLAAAVTERVASWARWARCRRSAERPTAWRRRSRHRARSSRFPT